MPIRHIGARSRTSAMGQLIPEALAVQVTDAAGNPAKDQVVVFETEPEGMGEFAPGGQSYASVNTDAQGIARVQLRPTREGTFAVRVTAQGQCNGLFEVRAVRADVIGAGAGGAVGPVIIHRRLSRPLGWPIAAIAIALVMGAAFLWLFERGLIRASGSGGTTRIVERGGGSTVDATARAEAQAARAAVDKTAAELRGELDSGLAANSAHDRGYGREYGRPTLRLALENARRIAANRHGDEPSASWRPPICRSDPDLPACRE